MASKKAAPTNDELLAQFDDLGVEETSKAPAPSTKASKTSKAPPQSAQSEQDLLAELDNLASQRPSRPATPRLASGNRSPKRTSTATPPSGPPSDDKGAATRKSTDSTRSFHQSLTPATTEESPEPEKHPSPPQQQGGGWWGGLFATATAAVNQAQAAVREIQKNEEAQKWAEQVRGNVGALKGLGGELRSMALPTFTSIIHTLAPPISSHERLQIHITHDLSGYPSLDPLIYAVFSRVMAQVEGGDLLVIQKGQEASPRRDSDAGKAKVRSPGWNDGPWWRINSTSNPRSINAVRGVVEGSKLARASAEAYATEFYASRGGVEEAAKQATEILSESNPVRSSDIFLAIQAIGQPAPKDLFVAGPTAEKEKTTGGVVEVPEEKNGEVSFAVYLHDPIHGIVFQSMSQAIPQQWIDWLDAAPGPSDGQSDEAAQSSLPEAIAEIIESGGIDPREWVAEWVEEAITLGVGVVAQRYVARRMGVGEGGVGRGKMRAEKMAAIEQGGGEAARAIGGM